jgi:lysophospholipase L1-like esterase
LVLQVCLLPKPRDQPPTTIQDLALLRLSIIGSKQTATAPLQVIPQRRRIARQRWRAAGTPFISDSERDYIQIPYDIALDTTSAPRAGRYTTNGTFKSIGEVPAPNAVEVPGSGYETIPTGTADLGDQITQAYLNMANHTRIRQRGTVTKASFYLASKPAQLTAFYFYIWRRNGGTYDLVSRQDILTLISGGSVNTITLPTPVDVIEGDYTGFGYAASSATPFFLKTIAATTDTYDGLYVMASTPSLTTNWEAQTHAAIYVPVHVTMDEAPLIAAWGDSLTAGYGSFMGYIDPQTSAIPNSQNVSIIAQLGQKIGVSIQNFGYSGQVLDQIRTRMTADLPEIQPVFALLNGGNNDGGATSATIISRWDNMLAACVAGGAIPIIVPILPSSAKDNGIMTVFDTVNAHLASVASTYGAIYCGSVFAAVGEFRSGGPTGNLWNIQAIYQYDTNHYNTLGNGAIADAILTDFALAMPTIVETNNVKVKFLRNFAASDVVTLSYDGTLVKSNADGTSAAMFTDVAVDNQVVPGIEALNFDDVTSWVEDSPGEWVGNLAGGGGAGRADKKISAGENGWFGTYKGADVDTNFGISDADDRVASYGGGGAIFNCCLMGFFFQGDGNIYKAGNYANGGSISVAFVTGRLYAIHKTVVTPGVLAHYDLKWSSDDGATWSASIHNYDDIFTDDVDIFGYGCYGTAHNPKGFNLAPH